MAWIEALKHTEGPSAIVLTRQALPPQEGVHKGSHHGAYVLLKEDGDHPEVILMASGSEVPVAVNAAKLLKGSGIDARVVSMLCQELFDAQTDQYKEDVLPSAIRTRVSVEAGITMGWEKYTGLDGLNIGLDRFGESAPGDDLMKHFGFEAEQVAEKVKKYLSV